MEKSCISVIVPIYNVEKYIDRCVNSLVKQTWRNLEIILVDDGSQDNSGTVCDKWAKLDLRIKVIHKDNGGVSSARNSGLKIATGEYIGFVDPDDYISYDMYDFLYESLNKNGSVISVCNWDNYINDKFSNVNDKAFFDTIKCSDAISREIYEGIFITCNKLFKKEIIEGLLYNENYINGEDRLFCIKALANGAKKNYNITYNMLPKYHYCHRPNSAGTKEFTPKDFTIIALCEEIKNIAIDIEPKSSRVVEGQISRAYLQLINMLSKSSDEKWLDYKEKLAVGIKTRFPGVIFEKIYWKEKLKILIAIISTKLYVKIIKNRRKHSI